MMLRLLMFRGLLTTSVLVGMTGAAAAQADECERAHLLESSAREHLAGGDAARATMLLQRALLACPTPSLRFNLALSLRAAGRSREAIPHLLELQRGEHDPEQEQPIASLLQDVRAQLGTVVLRLRPNRAGALVFVDGLPDGETDANGSLTLQLDPGRHQLRAQADGLEGSSSVDVESGTRQRLVLALNETSLLRRRRRTRGIAIGAALLIAGAFLAVALSVRDRSWGGDPLTGVSRT
ncbi:MAG: hypothetical protein JJ863_07335 [Deltaproteobacteria bacterium]|nr:hypothetical protein [Deltaproteobacteria bacterium]